MNLVKQDIIGAIAYSDIPSETTLMQRSLPGSDIKIMELGADHSGTNGLKLLAAQMFAEHLAAATSDLPDNVIDATLFRQLHVATAVFFKAIGQATVIEAAAEEANSEHRLAIATLKKLAESLNIKYDEPGTAT